MGTEEIRKAELEFLCRDVVNKLHLLAKLIPDQTAASHFNAQATAPLMELRRRFEMNSGRVIKVGRKP